MSTAKRFIFTYGQIILSLHSFGILSAFHISNTSCWKALLKFMPSEPVLLVFQLLPEMVADIFGVIEGQRHFLLGDHSVLVAI
uniref:Uncharacterized protein n=1 Tax=Megaselia scalaris TaxID=36166 RepID=T1GY35_MEGSC